MTLPTAPSSTTETIALPKLSTGPARTEIGGGEGGGRSGVLAATAGLAVRGAFLGYIAIVIGWAITEGAGIADARSRGPVALYTAVLAAVYALIVSASSDLRDRIWARALIRAAIGVSVGAMVGAIAGLLSNELFTALQQTQDPTAIRFYLLRALSWSAFGIGIGLVGGLTEQSLRKAINGLVGGLIGGALGGLLFHWVGLHTESASAARLVGLALVGTFVGAAIGLVEAARRQAWIRVIAGGLSGKEFILYHDLTTIGAAPKCQVTLIKDPSAAPFHAQIALDGSRRVVSMLDDAPILVNGSAVRSRALRSGDELQIGSTVLLYQERD